jgi:arabinofuranosyltransferase
MRARQRWRRLRAVLVTCAGVLACAAWLVPMRGFVTDDTYIHLVFARHFRDGLGLVFNPGEPVYGTTAPLWSLGLGALGRSGLDLLALAHVLAAASALGAVVAFAVFLRRFMDAWVDEFGYGAGRAELAWSLGVLAFATDAWLTRWAATGMESALATLLVTLGFVAYTSRRPWGASLVAPATWWTLAALVRPEAAVLVALLAVRAGLTHGSVRRRLARVLRVLVPAAVVALPWVLYALALYGTVVPATLAAKTAGGVGLDVFVQELERGAKALAGARAVELVLLVLLLPSLAARAWSSRAEHFVPVLWLLGLPLLYAARGVPVLSRYLLPVAPLVVAYAWCGLATVAAAARRRPAWAVAALVVVGVASVGWGAATTLRLSLPQGRAFTRDVEGSLLELGRTIDASTPAGAAIAMPDIGAIGYAAGRPVIDLAGLVTPAITPLLARYGYDDLVVHLRFEAALRPVYLIDRADVPERLLLASPYGPCFTPLKTVKVAQRGIQHPEPAYYTLYRIDWAEFDRLHGGERQARAGTGAGLRLGG